MFKKISAIQSLKLYRTLTYKNRNPSGDSWDILTNVRKKYPNIFSQEKQKKKEKEDNFDDFFNKNIISPKE